MDKHTRASLIQNTDRPDSITVCRIVLAKAAKPASEADIHKFVGNGAACGESGLFFDSPYRADIVDPAL